LTGELTVDEPAVPDAQPSNVFVIEYEITYIHTDEIIA